MSSSSERQRSETKMEGANPFEEIADITVIDISDDKPSPAPNDQSKEEKKADTAVPTPNYYRWDEICPEMAILKANIPLLLNEIKRVPTWVPWPEDHFQLGSNKEWTVFPFLYSFPAYDESSSKWVDSTCQVCPETVKLLKQIPNIRTALFSRLGPNTKLSTHTGWADLANYVLRFHVCMQIPATQNCGLIVNGEIKLHVQNEIICFDDSKKHRAFNTSTEDRIVLIVDVLRPPHLPLGTAVGGHTDELDSFMSYFK